MKKQHGFTLIELVVVIVILGILAVIAAPKFMNLQNDARTATLKGMKGILESTVDTVYAKMAANGMESVPYVVNRKDPPEGAIYNSLSFMGCKDGFAVCSFQYGYPSAFAPTLNLLINGIGDNSAIINDDFIAVQDDGILKITLATNAYKKGDRVFLKDNKCYVSYAMRGEERPTIKLVAC
ncbi:prepilin-type N-terminal cleavage/methylation domain-containing protein [Photobacterium toruni]|uniref:Type II secretion system protein G n=1 Tax=Photobacterium toruni TaxID=1935446 RepID=A0A1T4U1C7_9GAMM|nr:prepilin-type N-terminal cleavage/methylation domain-containing protein [Photobacterium toruni]MEC6817061.1 prepilin-type N-terminal cleavage/methylation domain-containing protein [Photobacterium toruni]SKA46288.1 Type II secretion system protein G precursor [Photobacterium toruni]